MCKEIDIRLLSHFHKPCTHTHRHTHTHARTHTHTHTHNHNNIPKAINVMLDDGAGTKGMEVLVVRETRCNVAGGVGSRGVVVPDADGRKGVVSGIVLAGTKRMLEDW